MKAFFLSIPSRFILPLIYFFFKMRGNLDSEMFVVEKILKRKHTFIDIGANYGLYSKFFCSQFKNVISIEPNEQITTPLKNYRTNISVLNVAVSDSASLREFKIPLKSNKERIYGLSSFEGFDWDVEYETITVKTIQLDELNLDNIDLIKIDVEGHEYFTLKGMVLTLKRNKPLLLIEIEERHSAVDVCETFSFLRDMAYDCFYLFENKLCPIENFNFELMQNVKNLTSNRNTYICNFIFVPKQ